MKRGEFIAILEAEIQAALDEIRRSEIRRMLVSLGTDRPTFDSKLIYWDEETDQLTSESEWEEE